MSRQFPKFLIGGRVWRNMHGGNMSNKKATFLGDII